jgi:hypothetical protein
MTYKEYLGSGGFMGKKGWLVELNVVFFYALRKRFRRPPR